MPRPLTAADRVPQVGDIVESQVFGPIIILPGGRAVYDAFGGIKSIEVKPHYKYRRRADGGSITTEGGS